MPVLHNIQYNSYALQNVTIDRYDSEPVFADDDITLITVRHVLAGTALIAGATDAAFKTEYDSALQKLMEPRKNLTIEFDDDADGLSKVVIGSISAPDELDGPKAKFSINKMIGARSAIITFEIEWNKYEPASGSVQDILAHWWRSSFSYDSIGRATYTVAGTLITNATTDNTTSGDISNPIDNLDIFAGRNADAYRLAVTPPVPGGFRRDQQEYAIDESGSRLIYTISFKEVARDLPSPARAGNGTLTWASSIRGDGLIGRKTFDIELEGRPDANASDLLAAAVNVSKTYIIWGPGQTVGKGATNGVDIIESIRVEERDIFNSVNISLRVTALSPRGVEAIGIPNASLLSDVVEGIDEKYSGGDISPYGASAIMSIRRTLRASTYTDIDHAEIEALADGESDLDPSGYVDLASSIYKFPDRVFDEFIAEVVPPEGGRETAIDALDHQKNPYIEVRLNETIDVVDTGMVALEPRASLVDGIRYQVRRPIVMLISDCTCSRVGVPPDRKFLKLPAGSMLRSDRMMASSARIDGNGNTIYTTAFRRISQLPRRIIDQNFVTDGATGIVSFWPKGKTIHTPFDPRIDPVATAEDSMLELRAGRNLPVGDRESYTT